MEPQIFYNIFISKDFTQRHRVHEEHGERLNFCFPFVSFVKLCAFVRDIEIKAFDVKNTSTMENLNVYKKSSRKDAKIAKDAKLLFVILSLYFQDSYYFKSNISCKTRIYRIETLRLCALAR